MRIVADTNVIVSALVFDGVPRQVLDLRAKGLCELCFSAAIQNEVERVLAGKFGWKQEDIDARVRVLWSWGTKVHPEISLSVIQADPDDDRILECAISSAAQAIISGDRHLLRLGLFHSIPIQTPRQFLDDGAWIAKK
jgi:putative PIN family toxin of toxin-antitoxin system